MKLRSVFAAVLVAAPVLAACSSDEVTFDEPISTINGEAPPGELAPEVDVTTLIDTINAEGERVVVSRGTRLPGTRAAIHVHENGGHTCVLSGTITDFVEGSDPMVWPAGTCYYMPADTPMTAANLGDEPAVLIDNFTVPQDTPTMTILEPGWDAAVAAFDAEN